jgi:hypothetical protein
MNYASLALNLFQSVLNEDWTSLIDGVEIAQLQKAPEMIIRFFKFKDEETLIKFACENFPHASEVLKNEYETYDLIQYTAYIPSTIGRIKILMTTHTSLVKDRQARFPSFHAIRRVD